MPWVWLSALLTAVHMSWCIVLWRAHCSHQWSCSAYRLAGWSPNLMRSSPGGAALAKQPWLSSPGNAVLTHAYSLCCCRQQCMGPNATIRHVWEACAKASAAICRLRADNMAHNHSCCFAVLFIHALADGFGAWVHRNRAHSKIILCRHLDLMHGYLCELRLRRTVCTWPHMRGWPAAWRIRSFANVCAQDRHA
jgi:hypothetical protein